MKRMVFSILMILALTAGVTYAQSTINTPAPGPTQQAEPGQTNNNLPNPGNPTPLANQDQQPVQEQGTVEGTAAESMNDTQGGNTTGNVTGTTTGTTTGTMDTTGTTTGTTGTATGSTGLQNETETGSGMDVDVDTGNRAEGAVDVDVNSTTDADTDASGVDETGSYDNDTDTLPSTASKLPLFGLIGLLALAAAFAVRRF
jgi:hypothetical protein